MNYQQEIEKLSLPSTAKENIANIHKLRKPYLETQVTNTNREENEHFRKSAATLAILVFAAFIIGFGFPNTAMDQIIESNTTIRFLLYAFLFTATCFLIKFMVEFNEKEQKFKSMPMALKALEQQFFSIDVLVNIPDEEITPQEKTDENSVLDKICFPQFDTSGLQQEFFTQAVASNKNDAKFSLAVSAEQQETPAPISNPDKHLARNLFRKTSAYTPSIFSFLNNIRETPTITWDVFENYVKIAAITLEKSAVRELTGPLMFKGSFCIFYNKENTVREHKDDFEKIYNEAFFVPGAAEGHSCVHRLSKELWSLKSMHPLTKDSRILSVVVGRNTQHGNLIYFSTEVNHEQQNKILNNGILMEKTITGLKKEAYEYFQKDNNYQISSIENNNTNNQHTPQIVFKN